MLGCRVLRGDARKCESLEDCAVFWFLLCFSCRISCSPRTTDTWTARLIRHRSELDRLLGTRIGKLQLRSKGRSKRLKLYRDAGIVFAAGTAHLRGFCRIRAQSRLGRAGLLVVLSRRGGLDRHWTACVQISAIGSVANSHVSKPAAPVSGRLLALEPSRQLIVSRRRSSPRRPRFISL